jgi:hypothetical protein
MPYPIVYKGVTISVESLEEAAELTQMLTADGKPRSKARTETPPPPPEGDQGTGESLADKLAALWKDLAEPERKLLTVLAKQAGKIGTDEVVASTGIEANNLKYSLKRIISRAKPHGIGGKQLVDSKVNYKIRPVKSTYWMQDKVKKAIVELLAVEGHT